MPSEDACAVCNLGGGPAVFRTGPGGTKLMVHAKCEPEYDVRRIVRDGEKARGAAAVARLVGTGKAPLVRQAPGMGGKV